MKLFAPVITILVGVLCIASPLYATDPTLPEAIDSLQ